LREDIEILRADADLLKVEGRSRRIDGGFLREERSSQRANIGFWRGEAMAWVGMLLGWKIGGCKVKEMGNG
jgi:hypothetical protein